MGATFRLRRFDHRQNAGAESVGQCWPSLDNGGQVGHFLGQKRQAIRQDNSRPVATCLCDVTSKGGWADCKTIVDKDFAGIGDLANLIAFSARQVPIGDEGVGQVARQRNLKWLYLTSTKVTDAVLPAIGGLTRLNELTLAGHPKITDAGLVHLRGLMELRALWLNNSSITGAGLKHLQNLPMLLSLGLPATTLAESDLKVLAAFRTLTFVNIDRTPGATDTGIAVLRMMPALTELHAGYSSISDSGLEVLATFPGLKKLHLPGSKVTDAGIQRFKAARPDCELFR